MRGRLVIFNGSVAEVFERELVGGSFDEAFVEVPSANGDVTIVSTDLDLFAIADRAAFGVDPQDHGRFAAAMADGFDFRQAIGPSQQVLAALEQVALEVGPKAISEHRDGEPVGDIAQLPDLGLGQELGFVDQDAMDAGGSVFTLGDSKEVIRGFEGDRIGGESNPRADFSFSEPVVDFRSENQRTHAPFAVVVARLQQYRGFARIHRRVVEVQLRQGDRFLRVDKFRGYRIRKTYTRKLNSNVK
jgi:hypothetical protein